MRERTCPPPATDPGADLEALDGHPIERVEAHTTLTDQEAARLILTHHQETHP